MSRERSTLQPWVRAGLNVPGWLCWKLEDKFNEGLPDCLVKCRETGRVTWLELKWSVAKTRVSATFSAGQVTRIREWGEGTFAVVAAESTDRVYLIPGQIIPGPLLSIPDDELACLPGVRHCRALKSDLGSLLRFNLT